MMAFFAKTAFVVILDRRGLLFGLMHGAGLNQTCQCSLNSQNFNNNGSFF